MVKKHNKIFDAIDINTDVIQILDTFQLLKVFYESRMTSHTQTSPATSKFLGAIRRDFFFVNFFEK